VSKNVIEFFKLYKTKFVPAYADYVALDQVKPEQILIEESNILSHLSQYFNESLDEKTREGNLIKATNHLQRIIIDLNKLIWVSLTDILKPIFKNPDSYIVFNLPSDEIVQKFSQFLNKGLEAREFEMNNIGNAPLETILKYETANTTGLELLKSLDEIKFIQYKKWTRIFKTKEFVAGIIASIIAATICWGASGFFGMLMS